MNTLADGREVVISRGELVEIGDSFRIPDVMTRAGGRLREVGTTNRTHLADYEQAIGPETRLILKVHRSNFQLLGFTADVEAASSWRWRNDGAFRSWRIWAAARCSTSPPSACGANRWLRTRSGPAWTW